MAHHQPIRRQTAGAGSSSGGPGSLSAHATREIPDKLYFRIGEVARLCEVATYVLRFWESEFPQLKPNKGGTGQRLFRRRDVEMALRIKRLLYDEGYTIPGARQLLKAEAKAKEPQLTLLSEEAPRERMLRTLRSDLHNLLLQLQAPPYQLTEGSVRKQKGPAGSQGRPQESVTELVRRRPHMTAMAGTAPVIEGLFPLPVDDSGVPNDDEGSGSTS